MSFQLNHLKDVILGEFTMWFVDNSSKTDAKLISQTRKAFHLNKKWKGYVSRNALHIGSVPVAQVKMYLPQN